MLEAVQGVGFDPEAPNDLEICLFYKLPLRLYETWHVLTLEDVPGQYISLMKVTGVMPFATKLSGFEFTPSDLRAFLTFKIHF